MTTDLWAATAGPDLPPGRGRVVLVHGTMDRSAGLLRLSRQLDRDWEVVRYDRRGYGRSPSDGPFGVAAQVDDLVAIVAGRPAVLVGHSFGGNVALAVADQHPELVRAVVVYESPMPWSAWWPGDSASARSVLAGEDPADAAEAFMRGLVGDHRWDRLPPATRAARRAEGRAMVAELADLRRQAPWRADRIGVPVLALSGEHGREHHRRAMQLLAEEVPDGRVASVPGAHHFGPNTHPAATAALITGFLERHAGV